MSNAFIGDRSWRKKSTYDASSADSNYPAANLKTDEVPRVWRSTDATAANTIMKVTLDTLRTVNVVALCNHNISRAVTPQVRVRMYRDATKLDMTADSGWVSVWSVIYTLDDPQASWDSGNAWDRIISAEDAENRTLDKALYFDGSPVAGYIEVEISDEANADGFVQVGILEVAAGFYLPMNFDYGAQFGVVSRTESVEAEGGSEYEQVRIGRDVFRGSSGLVLSQAALGRFYEFMRRTDKHTPFWWSADPADLVNALRISWLAKNAEIDLLTYSAYGRMGVPFNFKRVL